MKITHLLLAACALSLTTAVNAREHLKSLDPASIDNTTPASEDFFTHVNKGWMESHPLTPDYA